MSDKYAAIAAERAGAYPAALHAAGAVASMSRRGDC
jgi:hypothetical protein